MAEVYFYHLERQPLEQILPKLLAASLERGWRVVVQTDSEERAEALSAMLWTFRDDAFLPHGTRADGFAHLQPVWLTAAEANPNSATVRFFVDGAKVSGIDGLARAVVIFDAGDEAAMASARDDWKRFKAAGHTVSYWQQDENGRWLDRAKSG